MTVRFTCCDCRWWDFRPTEDAEAREDEKAVGYCRRMPPSRRDKGIGGWPVSFRDDWCGEYTHKDDISYQFRERSSAIT